MHIVFVTIELATKTRPSGGLASFTANMAQIFAEKGHNVTVILVTSKEENIELSNGICVENLYVRKSLWNFIDKLSSTIPYRDKSYNEEFRKFWLYLYKGRRLKKELKKINRRNKIDIVHYCNLGGLSAFHNKELPYVIRISGFLNICNAADKLDYKLGYKKNPLTIRERLEEYAIRKAKYVISPSKLLGEIAYRDIGIKTTVLESPFLLNQDNWDNHYYNKLAKGKKYILHYGTLSYLKGTYVVAQMVHTLLMENPDLMLIMVGKSKEISDDCGNKICIHELVQKNAKEHSDRVIYAGQLGREQLYPFIQNAELCLLPSRIENLSNACIEAMAMGKIVVATYGASYEQLIDDRVSGFLCERDNPVSYLKAVNEALNMSAEERDKMGIKALEVVKRLEPQKIYQQYLDFYEDVVREW